MTQANWQAVGTGSETSCSWPTHAAGDRGYLPCQAGGATVATPSGWSLVSGFPMLVPGTTELLYLFTRLAASGAESAAPLSGGANHMWGTIFTARNAHKTLPIHAIAVAPNTSGGAVAYLPEVSVSVDDLLIVNVFGWSADSAGPLVSNEANPTFTPTERYDAGTTTGNGGGLAIWSGTFTSPGMVGQTTADVTTPAGVVVTLALAPIADISITGTVTIDGSPAPNSSGGDPKVYLHDLTQPAASYLVLDAATETNPYSLISGGTGAFGFKVPYDDHEYIAVYVDAAGEIRGASDILTYSSGFPSADIDIITTSGGGGGVPHFAQPGVLRVPPAAGGGGGGGGGM